MPNNLFGSCLSKGMGFYHYLMYLLKYPTWLLSGNEKQSGEPLTAAFAGFEASKNYFAKLIFGDSYREQALENVWYWKLGATIRKIRDCSILFCEVPLIKKRFSPQQTDLNLPAWIEMEIDLSENPAVFLRRDRYSKIRREKIQRYHLTYEIKNDADSFDDFYFNMYEPHMKSRHEAAAVVQNYAELKRDFLKENSELLLVMKDGKSIGGLLIDYARQAQLHYLGVRDASPEYLRLGASEAAYYFSILRVKERGYDRVSLGHCRPFPHDGVFQYKTHYAAYVKAHHVESGWIGVSFLKRTRALESFLSHNPFISRNRNGYTLNFLKNMNPEEEWAQLIERYQKNNVRVILHPTISEFFKTEMINHHG